MKQTEILHNILPGNDQDFFQDTLDMVIDLNNLGLKLIGGCSYWKDSETFDYIFTFQDTEINTKADLQTIRNRQNRRAGYLVTFAHNLTDHNCFNFGLTDTPDNSAVIIQFSIK